MFSEMKKPTNSYKKTNQLRVKIRSQVNYMLLVDLLTTIFEDFGSVFLIFLSSLICFETSNDDLLSTAASVALYATAANCAMKTLLFFACCCDCKGDCCCSFILRTIRSSIAACILVFCVFIILVRNDGDQDTLLAQFKTGGGIKIDNEMNNNFDYKRDGSLFLYQPLEIDQSFDVERSATDPEYWKSSVKNICGANATTDCSNSIKTQNCNKMYNRISIGTLYSVYGYSIKDTFNKGFGIFRTSHYKIPCKKAFPYIEKLTNLITEFNVNMDQCDMIVSLNTTQKRPDATLHVQAFIRTTDTINGRCKKVPLNAVQGTFSGSGLSDALSNTELKSDIVKYECGTDEICANNLDNPGAGDSFKSICEEDCGKYAESSSSTSVTATNEFFLAIHNVQGTFSSCNMHYMLNVDREKQFDNEFEARFSDSGYDQNCYDLEDQNIEEFEVEEDRYSYPQFITGCS